MVEDVVKVVLERRPPLPLLRPGLTAQDIYYSQVAGIEDVLPSLLDYQASCLGDMESPAERLGMAVAVGSIIEVRYVFLFPFHHPLFLYQCLTF